MATRLPRRNRVDPLGDLHAVDARGLFTGNRGCLLDDRGRLVRHHRGALWIVCRTRYRDRTHPLDGPRTWTPLFFLDDAVALAAGHRPCGFCRREDYLAYRSAVTVAGVGIQDVAGIRPVSGSGATPTSASDATVSRPVGAPELNRRLAAERHRRGRGLVRSPDRILIPERLDAVPSGAVVIDPSTGCPNLVEGRWLQPFSFDGWGPPVRRPPGLRVDVITPPTSLAALRHAFVPRLHPSAIGGGDCHQAENVNGADSC